MQVIPFIVESVPEAVAQIRAQLGPEAVVLSVRKLEAGGLARLWQKPRLEVLAYRPETPAAAPAAEPEAMASLRKEVEAIKQQFRAPEPEAPPPAAAVAEDLENGRAPGLARPAWRIEGMLQLAGFLKPQAKQVVDALRAEHGEAPPDSMAEEVALARQALIGMWRKPLPFTDHAFRPHVLVGPAGVGKTTCLCKWLTQEVLVEGGTPAVWRLDGAISNHAEFLNVYAEILGVQVERVWRSAGAAVRGETSFIDLPGVDWRNPAAIAGVREQLTQFPAPQVHLVLNAAYELPVLVAQLRAFEPLAVTDVMFTHLDEEPRAGKLWNFVLGTNCAVRFLSAGQNIPGEFREATAERLLASLFPGK